MGTPGSGVRTRLEGDSAVQHPLRNWWIANVGTDLKDPMVKADLEEGGQDGTGTEAGTLTWSMRRVKFEEEP
jgi:hypothetical protein